MSTTEQDRRDRGQVEQEIVERQPARLAMMMLGGSPIRVAVPPMLEASTSAIRNGTGRSSRSQTSSGDRSDQQHGGDVVEQRGGHRGDDDEHDHDPERAAPGRLAAQIARYSNTPVCRSTPTMIIMPEQQEDDVPVDAGVLGEERRVGVDHADQRPSAPAPPRAAATRWTRSVAIRTYATTKTAGGQDGGHGSIRWNGWSERIVGELASEHQGPPGGRTLGPPTRLPGTPLPRAYPGAVPTTPVAALTVPVSETDHVRGPSMPR